MHFKIIGFCFLIVTFGCSNNNFERSTLQIEKTHEIQNVDDVLGIKKVADKTDGIVIEGNPQDIFVIDTSVFANHMVHIFNIDSITSFRQKESSYIPIIGEDYRCTFQDQKTPPEERNEGSYYYYSFFNKEMDSTFITVIGAKNSWIDHILLLVYLNGVLLDKYELAAYGSIHNSIDDSFGERYFEQTSVVSDELNITTTYNEFIYREGIDSLVVTKSFVKEY